MRIKYFSIVLAFMLFGIVLPVGAQEDVVDAQETVQSTAEEKKAARDERLESIKQAQTEKIDAALANRIKQRCKSAQGKVTSVRARVTSVITNRKIIYAQLSEKLNKVTDRLTDAGIDTTALTTIKADIQSDLDILNDALDAHDITLGDLSEMDCESDPEAFYAALKSAREQQAQIRTFAQELRTLVTTQLRSELQNIRSQLETKEETEN